MRAHFSKPALVVVQEFLEKEKNYATKHRIKGELVTQPHDRPSENSRFYRDVTFEQVRLHLVLSSYLTHSDLASLNQCHPLFAHLCTIFGKIKLSHVYDLFDYEKNCSKQVAIPSKKNCCLCF